MPWTVSRLCRASPCASSSSACGCRAASAACGRAVVTAGFIAPIHSDVWVALFMLFFPVDVLKRGHQCRVDPVDRRIERHAAGALIFPVASDLAEMPERKFPA